MSQFQQRSRSSDRFTRLSLEQLESRSVPSTVTFRVASEIVHSVESYSDFVTAEYRSFLGRSPDTAGRNFFVSQLLNGVTPQLMDAEFVSSTEYIRNHGGTASTWISGMFHDLLGRSPSSSEVNFFAVALAQGASTFQIGLTFATSVERDVVVVTLDYRQLLGRAPDAGGLDLFVGALRNGTSRFDVTSAIISSTEYIVDHGASNTGFVTGAFQNVLGRSPNSAELSFFVQQLNTL